MSDLGWICMVPISGIVCICISSVFASIYGNKISKESKDEGEREQ